MKLLLCAAVLTAATANADVLRLDCQGTTISVDTKAATVTVRYPSGFSNSYKNGTDSETYRFTDGTESPFTSTETVSIGDREIGFSNRYQRDGGLTMITNVIDRKTGRWRIDESGKVTDKHCTGF